VCANFHRERERERERDGVPSTVGW